MPFVYHTPLLLILTSGTPNTEAGVFTWKPGSRNLMMHSIFCGGFAGGLVAITGLAIRIKKWTTTATSPQVAATLVPEDTGAQAAKASCGFVVPPTVGSGGPLYMGGFVCGAGGPGGWKAKSMSQVMSVEGSANQSLDLFTSSAVANMQADAEIDVME